MAEALCLLSLVLTFFLTRKSLANGLIAMVGIGYLYGILRANLLVTASHFIFDGAVLGVYGGAFTKRATEAARIRVRPLIPWLAVLTAWPIMMFCVPIQDPLIQLVGLRGAIFFLPFLLIGPRLEEDDFRKFATGVAILNVAELGIALLEFALGLESFYPHNAVTDLIYRSSDAGGGNYRIPATFVNSATYAGGMCMSFTYLAGVWARPGLELWRKRLLEAAMVASALGVFLGASRSWAVLMGFYVAAIFFSFRMSAVHRFGLVVILLVTGWFVSKSDRLQRFTTLTDTDYVTDRIHGSVNSSFVDVLQTYPMGNGLGAGGTSVPYFLQDRLPNRNMVLENEYALVLLEQGVLGLFLRAAFSIWMAFKTWPGRARDWHLARLLLWGAIVYLFLTGLLGTGLMTAIPQTALMFMSCGWMMARSRDDQAASRAGGTQPRPLRPALQFAAAPNQLARGAR